MSSRDRFRPKPRARLRPVSERRRDVNRQRAAAQLEAWGPRPWPCRFAELPTAVLDSVGVAADDRRCYGRVDGHELLKRSRSGSDSNLVDVSGQVPLCAFHNGFIEDEPLMASSLGLSLPSWR